MANNIVLVGRNALDYLETINVARRRPFEGLSVAPNEVDDGYDPATPNQAIEAADEDPSLVRLELTAERSDAELVAIAELLAADLGKRILGEIADARAIDSSTPGGLAVLRLRCAFNVDDVDTSEYIPGCFRDYQDEILSITERCYLNWMDDHSPYRPARLHELAALQAETVWMGLREDRNEVR
jgi:hypothetical protein